jgi:hypothetical protein
MGTGAGLITCIFAVCFARPVNPGSVCPMDLPEKVPEFFFIKIAPIHNLNHPERLHTK